MFYNSFYNLISTPDLFLVPFAQCPFLAISTAFSQITLLGRYSRFVWSYYIVAFPVPCSLWAWETRHPWPSSSSWEFLIYKGWRIWFLLCSWLSILSPCSANCSFPHHSGFLQPPHPHVFLLGEPVCVWRTFPFCELPQDDGLLVGTKLHHLLPELCFPGLFLPHCGWHWVFPVSMMSYDHFVAICHPMWYTVTMNPNSGHLAGGLHPWECPHLPHLQVILLWT